MGIDGIGKPPGAGIGGIGGTTGKDGVRAAESFKLDPSASTAPGGKVSAALASLQRGELSLDQYLDGRVDDATSHLVGKLSPDQLEFVKQSLRDQMATDPVLVELVQRTTGSVPASELR
ncbi:MAG TPA: hypothetical protein VER11_29460 [Polyangiaceae bacterium]|jgi:hypothetical protein|nr:hypothetical protein [Polyangiaceae bacterium]